uniref:Uncharacterized protein n=1 Tax=Kryptolebias marmoratus TaxID=37003 RepID=A0A3Q3BFM2_KRYMA
MGQVLGFSHCRKDSSKRSPSIDCLCCVCLHLGGNEESEVFELQTAREWSDDDDDDEASSSSIWGTPRQNSFELTFSYIAIAEAEAVGASRHHRERRRGASRACRAPLIRTDTLETLLDSPDVDWDPQAFLGREEEEEEGASQERVEPRTVSPAGRRGEEQTEPAAIQSAPQTTDLETHGTDAGVQRAEALSQNVQQNPPQTVQGKKQDVLVQCAVKCVINWSTQ